MVRGGNSGRELKTLNGAGRGCVTLLIVIRKSEKRSKETEPERRKKRSAERHKGSEGLQLSSRPSLSQALCDHRRKDCLRLNNPLIAAHL